MSFYCMLTVRVKDGDNFGEVNLPATVFSQLRSDFFVSGSSRNSKIMMANSDEARHLKSLGIKLVDNVEFYVINLEVIK